MKAINAAASREKSIRHGHGDPVEFYRRTFVTATLKFDDSDFQSGTEPND